MTDFQIEIHMPKTHCKNVSNIVNQVSIFPPKPIAVAKMCVYDKFLDECQHTEFKTTIINFIKDSRSLKKLINESKEKEPKENKYLNDAQENTNLRLMAMMKTTYGLKIEFNRRKKQKRTHPERAINYLIITSTRSRRSHFLLSQSRLFKTLPKYYRLLLLPLFDPQE